MSELILAYGGAITLTAILIFLGSRYQAKRRARLQKWHEEDMENLRRLLEKHGSHK